MRQSGPSHTRLSPRGFLSCGLLTITRGGDLNDKVAVGHLLIFVEPYPHAHRPRQSVITGIRPIGETCIPAQTPEIFTPDSAVRPVHPA